MLIVLIVLTAATALNLFLMLRLAAHIRAAAEAAIPTTLPIGEAVPPFEGQRRADGRRVASGDWLGQPAVLAFLSPGCSACQEKVAELLSILPAIRRAGVALWIIPNDDRHDIAGLVGGTELLDHVLVLDAATRLRLNPRKGAPFYVFIDDRMIAQASNYVGDEDWQSFLEQMREIAAGEGPP